MPAQTPTAAGEQTPDGVSMLPTMLGANIRAYRLLKRLEQQDIADQMERYSHPWRRTTVSEVERGRRNVTVWELIALVVILDASVEELLDPRGPGGRGERLAMAWAVETGSDGRRSWLCVLPEDIPGLICTHPAGAEVERAPRRLGQIQMEHIDYQPGADEPLSWTPRPSTSPRGATS